MGNDFDIGSIQDKIDRLNERVWDLRANDSLKAFEINREFVGLARSASYQKGLAEGLHSLGFGFTLMEHKGRQPCQFVIQFLTG